MPEVPAIDAPSAEAATPPAMPEEATMLELSAPASPPASRPPRPPTSPTAMLPARAPSPRLQPLTDAVTALSHENEDLREQLERMATQLAQLEQANPSLERPVSPNVNFTPRLELMAVNMAELRKENEVLRGEAQLEQKTVELQVKQMMSEMAELRKENEVLRTPTPQQA